MKNNPYYRQQVKYWKESKYARAEAERRRREKTETARVAFEILNSKGKEKKNDDR